ncbi:MAG TPA: SDR family oxidoreductase, partial [Vicinamibacterales bacterium]|nr:SDR family oxidoreductase [Vicinamibacterales bacterium]
DSVFRGASIVVHLAAVTAADLEPATEAEVESRNYECARLVAEACTRAGCRLLVPSTTSVYGAVHGDVDESSPIVDLPANHRYVETKFRIEQMLRQQARGGLRYAVLRFGTIYGTSPGARFDTAVNKFCWQAARGESLTVWRTALDQTRPYLALDDAVRALRFVMQEDLFGAELFNVVSQNATVRDVVAGIRGVMGGAAVELVESPIMTTTSFSVSAARLQRLGCRVDGDLGEGIRRVIESLKALHVHA